ncbi:radical SAM/SPASM domain-containing protein [Clostridium malenominatum]|uniref:Radical SAM/SPASM domain-containing protein n=1 Tax=Clostridium malenominatum TaxID=1539 RepID=A0ABN1J5D3_9CLOT
MKKFKKFYIEITNVCNLACSFCPETRRASEFMKIETFNNILEGIKPHTEYIYFHIKGEPLLHPNIDKFLELSYEKGFKVNITTNGTLINKVKDKLLKASALRQINFSLHSFDGNDMNINKEDYIKNIIEFTKEALESTNMLISFRLWNLDEDNVTNLQREINRNILDVIENDFNLPYKIEEKVVPGRGIKIKDRLYLNQDHQFQWPDLKNENEDREGFCYGLRNQVGILVDGTVVPCCLDGEGIVNLGNIHKNSFTQIIEGERANRLVNGFSKRELVEELCRKCGYRQRFNV